MNTKINSSITPIIIYDIRSNHSYMHVLTLTSVEEIVTEAVMKSLKGSSCKLHPCGREDIDVRCLGLFSCIPYSSILFICRVVMYCVVLCFNLYFIFLFFPSFVFLSNNILSLFFVFPILSKNFYILL